MLASAEAGALKITNNVFYSNEGALGTEHHTPATEIRNNVALSNREGFMVTNIAAASFDYNVAWNNSLRDWDPEPGRSNTTADPMFENAAGGDFRLRTGSALIDAGDPDVAYDDADGSRNDIGIFGGPHGGWSPP